MIPKRIDRYFPKKVQIGRYQIQLPSMSRLPEYMRDFRLYDVALGKIADALYSKYPDIHAIDIGANVGDTAARIRQTHDIPVLCIEGDRDIIGLLQVNAMDMGAGILIEESFVGQHGASATIASAHGLNASLEISETGTRLKSLSSILALHSWFRNAKLLKTDTEGFDFDIVRQSMEWIASARPIVFMEYDPAFRPEEPDAGLETLRALSRAGYTRFLYYDNFGNFLLNVRADDTQTQGRLHAYLASHRKHGTAVYYFDVSAVHEEDEELIVNILQA